MTCPFFSILSCEKFNSKTELTSSLHVIGDAYAPRNLRAAMVDGARVGRDV